MDVIGKKTGMNFQKAFWVTLILFLTLIVAMLIYALVLSFQTPETLDGMFRIQDFPFAHLGATQMDVLILLAYKSDPTTAKVPTYAAIYQTLQTVLNSPSFAATHPWERVAQDISRQISNDYDVVGVSTELLIPPTGTTGDVKTATCTRGYANRLMKLDATVDGT